ncbi:DUF916 and DUF3324 domain-containing protein [Candidatus Enterococcus ferrettii]|uniref:DUF3324 domain-containing protein n=1 Tax=Candidatus Enterococcus ferrettii TaxID=2815324 RepID=A0ABV0EP19_9ENTE|nr:DUF916 and DUF3324 domain-containing protein [Enterococcus sp. 665A]MBO1340910.1 DUF916 and DUF3324 domain-containing protein [Enterococcus sp. 665A]
MNICLKSFRDSYRWVKGLPAFFLFFISLLFFSCPAFGQEEQVVTDPTDETKSVENDVGFTVEPVLPGTQVDESKGYYYIRTKPSEPQELTLRIRSTNKQPAKVIIYVKDAYTNQNGAIDYDSTNYTRDKTLVQSLEEITEVSEKEVTVENYESKEVTIKVTPPEVSFEGVKGGAVCVMNAESKEEKEGLRSSFGYRIGLLVTESADTFDDGGSLNLVNVRPEIHQGKRVIQARLQNPEAKVLKELTVKATLRKKGETAVLRQREATGMRMAPNSQFDFAVNWGIDPIKPGTYCLKVQASSGENTWDWEKEFTIGEKEAKKLNEEASYTLTYPQWIPLVVVVLAFLTIGNLGMLYLRRKKWINRNN